jgi:hypothetical protein
MCQKRHKQEFDGSLGLTLRSKLSKSTAMNKLSINIVAISTNVVKNKYVNT